MFKHLKHMKNEKGLTLIELLAVIVILAIIAAIAIPAIGNIINNSRDKAILSEASNILSAAKLANVDNKCSVSNTTVTCDGAALKPFVDGIDVTATDTLASAELAGGTWSITYARFVDLKGTDYKTGITGNTISEEQLSANLGK